MMKTRRTLAIAASMLLATTLTGCANLFTVDRTTKFEDGTAIHLDAQQRLVLFTEKEFAREKDTDEQEKTGKQKKTDKEKYYTKYTYCAEPSPDAISSYAGALGFNILDPSQGEVSFANKVGSATSNMGLRTESITLMRDVFYRICEAYNNGSLTDGQVSELFRRSQNLNAVVLAVEQLTGTVKSNPTLVLNRQLLEKQQLLDQAKDSVRKRQKEVNAAENELSKIRDSRGVDEETTKGAENNLKYAKERLKDAIEVRDSIQKSRNDTLTNVTAETQGSGQFSISVQPHLNAKAAKEIATAVKEMVTEVISKNNEFELFKFCLQNEAPESNEGHKACQDFFETHGKIEELYKKINESIKRIEKLECAARQVGCIGDRLGKQIDRLGDQIDKLGCVARQVECAARQVECAARQVECVAGRVECVAGRVECVAGQVECSAGEVRCAAGQGK